MVCLAVDVIGDSAANGDKLCPGTDHGQPSLRAQRGYDLFQADTGLAFQDSLLLIESDEVVETCAGKDIAFPVNGLVAIASSQPPGNEAVLRQIAFEIIGISGGEYI